MTRCRRGVVGVDSSKSRNSLESAPLGRSGEYPFGRYIPAWLVDFCCHRGLRGWTWECEFVGKGAYEARQKALRLAHYQQLWPNGTPRRATQCCTGPHRPRAPVQPSPALPPPALRQRNLIARSIIIFVTPRSPPCSMTPLFLFRRDFPSPSINFPSPLIPRNKFYVRLNVFMITVSQSSHILSANTSFTCFIVSLYQIGQCLRLDST